MKIKELLRLIRSDLNFYGGKGFLKAFYTFLFSSKLRVMINYRIGRYFYLKNNRLLVDWLKYRQITKRSCQISYSAIIGEQVEFKHPLGVVIGANVIIESNVKIWQQVTIGSHGKSGEKLNYPTIKEGVKIFAGAKVFGGIEIGQHSVIAANAVVNKTVKPNDVVAGMPAKSVKKA